MISIRELDLNRAAVNMPFNMTQNGARRRSFLAICTDNESTEEVLNSDRLPRPGMLWTPDYEPLMCLELRIESRTEFPSIREDTTGEVHFTVVASYGEIGKLNLGGIAMPETVYMYTEKQQREMEAERARHRPFVDAILNEPDNDLPRLVYADYLDDRGDYDQAELIRMQCALARMPEAESEDSRDSAQIRSHCRERIIELLKDELNVAKWSQCDTGAGGIVRKTDVGFRRGFVMTLRNVRESSWLRHGRSILERYPIELVTFHNNNRVNGDMNGDLIGYEIHNPWKGLWVAVYVYGIDSPVEIRQSVPASSELREEMENYQRGLQRYLATVGRPYNTVDGRYIAIYNNRQALLDDFETTTGWAMGTFGGRQWRRRYEGQNSWGQWDHNARNAGQELALQMERMTLETMQIPVEPFTEDNPDPILNWRDFMPRSNTPLIADPRNFIVGTEDATITPSAGDTSNQGDDDDEVTRTSGSS